MYYMFTPYRDWQFDQPASLEKNEGEKLNVKNVHGERSYVCSRHDPKACLIFNFLHNYEVCRFIMMFGNLVVSHFSYLLGN